MLKLIADIATANIIGTYVLAALHPERQRPFHWANAIGCVPLIAVEAMAGVGQAVVLSAMFGAAGWLGVWRTR